MAFKLEYYDDRGVKFTEKTETKRQTALNTAACAVNNGIADKVEVYTGYTCIYIAQVPKKPCVA